MTAAQTMLYFREWGRVRDVRKSAGLPCGDIERHTLHKRALGVAKSSKDFTNADLDKVLAAMRAITQPGDLTAQLRALDQPELRIHEAHKACLALLTDLGIGAGEDMTRAEWLRQSYLDGIVSRITRGQKLNYSTLSDREANHILHTLQRRLLAQQQAKAKHKTPQASAADLARHNCAF